MYHSVRYVISQISSELAFGRFQIYYC